MIILEGWGCGDSTQEATAVDQIGCKTAWRAQESFSEESIFDLKLKN